MVLAWALALAARTLPRVIGVAIGLTVAWVVAIAILVAYRPVAVVVVHLVGEDFINEARVAPPIPDWQRLIDGMDVRTADGRRGRRVRGRLLPHAASAPARDGALLLVALPSVLPEPAADAAPPGIATGPLGLEGPLRLPPRFSLSTQIRSPTTGLSARLRLPDRPVNVSAQLFLGLVHVVEGPFVPPRPGRGTCCDRGAPAAALAAAWGAVPPDTKLTPNPGFVFFVATRTRPGFATASSTWTRRPGCGSRARSRRRGNASARPVVPHASPPRRDSRHRHAEADRALPRRAVPDAEVAQAAPLLLRRRPPRARRRSAAMVAYRPVAGRTHGHGRRRGRPGSPS